MTKILIGLGFSIVVAAAMYFFGASVTTCWFTFLILFGFMGLSEISDSLYSIELKLDAVETRTHILARIESKLDGIASAE
jgi:hypothetical protein